MTHKKSQTSMTSMSRFKEFTVLIRRSLCASSIIFSISFLSLALQITQAIHAEDTEIKDITVLFLHKCSS